MIDFAFDSRYSLFIKDLDMVCCMYLARLFPDYFFIVFLSDL
jgi:hypothetical protein